MSYLVLLGVELKHIVGGTVDLLQLEGLIGRRRSPDSYVPNRLHVPLPFTGTVKLPAGKTISDIEQACATGAFPKLATIPGPQTAIAPVPQLTVK
ncbi:class II peroxidase [Sphaerobolus stellatus SS14]|uniref:Class II peroxidase n=1 Tax=Sphaerobolus stellatus (strain SS14) TaxID=990650 RepID=A0A0C9UVD1_SPHS4|nr:class II peroxidase [Sphaerobolus stellatus SS14]